jgi:hypothetical protein
MLHLEPISLHFKYSGDSVVISKHSMFIWSYGSIAVIQFVNPKKFGTPPPPARSTDIKEFTTSTLSGLADHPLLDTHFE